MDSPGARHEEHDRSLGQALNRRPSRLRVTVIAVSLAVGALLMGVKFWAWALTGSAAILSDALESIINVVAAGFALATVLGASRPPDRDHPYGHGKLEYFSAGFEGSLIILAAVAIVYEAAGDILAPRPLPDLGLGTVVVAGAGVVNLGLGLLLVWAGRRTGSLAVTADGKHVLTDVITSVGVVAGLVVVHLTGWLWLDGVVACLVAVNILFMGVGIVRQAFAGLMDSTDPELLERICKALSSHRRPAWIDVHRLRARQAGPVVLLDFHLILPRDLSFREVHDELELAEDVIRDEFEGLADVLIHADPCTEESCTECDRDACDWRSADCEAKRLWNGDAATDGVDETGE